MNVSSLQKKLSFPVGEVMAALLVAQPLLDVLSYFMGQADATWLTTALRTVLLFAVGVYGFSITENRRAYYVMYGVVGGFWVLHMLSCLRLGYQDPVGDAAEYLKLVQFPLWTLSFVTFFRQRRPCCCGACAASGCGSSACAAWGALGCCTLPAPG